MSALIIGDVHGLVNSYHTLLDQHKPDRSIQVGDFGLKRQHVWHRQIIDGTRHKVNFGNHDDCTFLTVPHSTGNWSVEDLNGQKAMTIRGAFSIDRHNRTEGVDWWANEEMTYREWQACIDVYAREKPDVVISHDCPALVRAALFDIRDKSITSDGLQACFEAHRPRLWLFGHHHRPRQETIEGTRFRCLGELEAAWL